MPRQQGRGGGSIAVRLAAGLLLVLLAAAPCAATTSSSRIAFQSVTALPGCSGSGAQLAPELSHCSWSVQMQRQSLRWYSFEVGAGAAANMSVVIMARAVSGQITMALWGPGSEPSNAPPTQRGTNYMEWPGLREADQAAAAAGGGHASLASEQQFLFLSHRAGKPLLAGTYVFAVQADMGQPLVEVEVSTPSSMTQLVAEEQEALKELVRGCCPGLQAPAGSSEALAAQAAAAAGLGGLSGWCTSVGRAVTYDLREWFSDICHVAPNVCSHDGHLQRLVLPPYALHCGAFPTALAKFRRLRHLDISYSIAPGRLSDVAAVVAQLPELRQLHVRGAGLSGPLGCDIVHASTKLQVLALSDNDKLSGSLPACWLSHPSLQELQLAGLSDLHGELPDATKDTSSSRSADGTSSSSSNTEEEQQLCGFGRLRYLNMAGIIGDAGLGFTGSLPPGLGLCKELLYLDLAGHSLSGPLGPLPPALQFLNLSSNGLSGSLPEFAVESPLQYMDLSFNRFDGQLQDMTRLPKLDWLDVSDNYLSGPMPALPPSLRWCDLSNNRLSGELRLPSAAAGAAGASVVPGQHSGPPLLVLLNAANNHLTGAIPAALAKQVSLAFLDLSHNQLSGDLHAFAAALPVQNQLLQFNVSHNQLSGDIPAQLQHLAAVRPVMVTMKDGLTPVTRIFDVSANAMSGVFPAWLITNAAALMGSCHCTVGINLDSAAFSCPTALPRLAAEAQGMLRRFPFLQCATDQRQVVPVWQVAAGGAGRRGGGGMSRAEHKAAMEAWQAGSQQRRHSIGVMAVVGALAALAAAAAAAVQVQRYLSSHQEQRAVSGCGYSRLPDFSTSHHPPSSSYSLSSDGQSSSPHCSDGSASPCFGADGSPRIGGSPTASTGSGTSGRSRLSSSTGDGSVEIALVSRPPSGEQPSEQQQSEQPGSKDDSFLL